MSKVTQIFGQFANDQEKNDFIESQFKVITNLTKENDQLKLKLKNLEDVLAKSTPLLDGPNNLIQKEGMFSSHEETIAREQLRLLNNTSIERELTLEEARKVDMYSKILIQCKNEPKKVKSSVEGLGVAELLKIVEEK